jgi:putative Mn2+ efflux pump MntP
MSLLPFIIFSLLLSFVPFSVALSSSIYRCIQWKEALRIAFVFAIFQVAMMALGWILGFSIKVFLYGLAVPVAAMIVFYIGARMFLDSRKMRKENRTMAVENNRILFGFAFVISINTALTGMGLGIIFNDILIFSGFIFLIVFLMTLLGIQAGKRGMMNLGLTLEMLGGIGMIILSIVIVLQHLKIF